MGHVRGIGTARTRRREPILTCFGDLNDPNWHPFNCAGTPTWVTAGWRPIRPRRGLDVALVPSCDDHLFAVRAYCSEYGPCESMDPTVAGAYGRQLRDREAPSQRVIWLESTAS